MGKAEGMVTEMGGRASIDAAARRGCLENPSTPSAVPSDFPIDARGGRPRRRAAPRRGQSSGRSGRSPRTTVTPFLGKGEGGKVNHAA